MFERLRQWDRVLCCCVAVWATTAGAEPSGNDTELDEIVVTAARRELGSDRLSLATASVDRAALRDVALLTDAFVNIDGVALQQTTPGQGAAIIRGQRGSSVLHLVDGIRVNNAIFRSAPTQYFALIPQSAAARLEVVRGTPTSLYGSDAVGGAIQLITVQPWYERGDAGLTGDVQIGADTAEQKRELSARIDAAGPGVAASFSGEYREFADRRVGGGSRPAPSAYRSRAGRLWLGIEPADRQRWSLDLQFAEQPSTPRVDELVAGFGQTEPASDEFFFEPNRRSFAHLRYAQEQAWLGGDLTASLAWQRIDDDRRSRDRGAPERRLERNRSDLTGATVALAGLDDNGSWVIGAEHYRDEVSSSRIEQTLVDGSVTVVPSRFPDGAVLTQSAVYVNGERAVSARQRISGGLRVSRVEIDLPATDSISASRLTVTDPSGDLGYIANLGASLDVIANLGFGFRAPNVFDLGSLGDRAGNRFNVPSVSLDSEQVTSADVGLRWRRGPVQAEFVVYRLDYNDRIASVLTGEQTPTGRDIVRSENVADAVVDGIEASFSWQVAEAWRLAASATYTRGEQSTDDGSDEPGDRIPPLELRVRTRYEPSSTWFAELGINGARRQHRLSSRDVRDSRIDPAGTAGWLRVDAAAGYNALSGWQLRVAAENLTDTRYRRHGSGIDAVGRNIAVSWRYVW
ncbi:MAG: TonB-dependent receptor [Pseudomonadota bacterium]